MVVKGMIDDLKGKRIKFKTPKGKVKVGRAEFGGGKDSLLHMT